MGLATQYRPQKVKHVVGQPDAVKKLQALLKKSREKVPHAYLFGGPSGCGKTTLARAFAKELGCDDADMVEMNTADFRGIDMARDLRVTSRLSPMKDGGVRAFVLDECHRLTPEAQDALLKVVEEPARTAYFFFCTTDVDKIKNTLAGRCSKFQLQPIGGDVVAELILSVAAKEGRKVDVKLADKIAEVADGSAREALNILEQVIDLPADERMQAVNRFDTKTEGIEICRAIWQGKDWKYVAKLIKEVLGNKDVNQIAESLRWNIMGYASSIISGGRAGDSARAAAIIECFRDTYAGTCGKNGLWADAFAAVEEIKGKRR